MPSSSTPRPGRQSRPTEPILLEGKFRLLEELGRGGMGTVFHALDESLERPVAIKFLLPEIQANKLSVERFRREARAMASINNTNVVKVYSFGRYGPADFIATEYIDGQPLEEVLDAAHRCGTQVKLPTALDILLQATTGLAAVHRAGVVHRDIKPGNVMIENDSQRVVIMDFGIGRRIEPETEQAAVGAGGTPAYMAPEIIKNLQLDPRREHLVDIYAFGVTAFELLTSRLPFDGETWIEVLEKHLDDEPPRPSEFREDLPKELDDLILKCLEKDPGDRYQDSENIHNELKSIASLLQAKQSRSLPPVVQRPAAHARRTHVPQESLQVIISDPDPGFRKSVFETVKQQLPGCRVISTRHGHDGIRSRDPSALAIFVASLHDHDLSGLEFAATLGSDMDLGSTALILTAERLAESEKRLLERIGPVQVLVKPIVPLVLHAAFRRAGEVVGFETKRPSQRP